MLYSPLRYPGGKNKILPIVKKICEANQIEHFLELFCGGANLGLNLLIGGTVSTITINDRDPLIYAFWYSVLHHSTALCFKIREARVDIQNWRRQKKILDTKNDIKDLIKLGFAAFFLNRTNFNGILSARPIGGLAQTGRNKIDSRFPKKKLIQKIKFISKFSEKINLIGGRDALEIIKIFDKKKSKINNKMFYFDPPYLTKSKKLYDDSLFQKKDHSKLAFLISNIKSHWIISYDACDKIQRMYHFAPQKLFYSPRELMFFSKNIARHVSKN